MQFTTADHCTYAKLALILYDAYSSDTANMEQILGVGYIMYNKAQKGSVIHDVMEYLHLQQHPPYDRDITAENPQRRSTLERRLTELEPSVDLHRISEQDQRDFADFARRAAKFTVNDSDRHMALLGMLYMVQYHASEHVDAVTDTINAVHARIAKLKSYWSGDAIPRTEPMARNIDQLIAKLREYVALGDSESVEQGSFKIVDEMHGSTWRDYEDLEKNSPLLSEIHELASDLEWSHGDPEELPAMWTHLKQLVQQLESQYSTDRN